MIRPKLNQSIDKIFKDFVHVWNTLYLWILQHSGYDLQIVELERHPSHSPNSSSKKVSPKYANVLRKVSFSKLLTQSTIYFFSASSSDGNTSNIDEAWTTPIAHSSNRNQIDLIFAKFGRIFKPFPKGLYCFRIWKNVVRYVIINFIPD